MLVPSRGGAEGRGQTAGSWWGEGARPLADQPNGEGEVGGQGKERRLVFCFCFFLILVEPTYRSEAGSIHWDLF